MKGNNATINACLFIILMTVRATCTVFVDFLPPILANIDYLVTVFIILIFMLQVIYSGINGKKLIYLYELANMGTSVVVIVLLSLYYCHKNYYGNWNFRSTVEIFYLIIAMLIPFCCINLFELKKMDKLMKVLLVIYIVLYIFEIGQTSFSFNDILKISLKNSYSPFESQKLSAYAMLMFVYFSTFKNRENYNSYIISIFFVLFAFKRTSIIFMCTLLVLDTIFIVRKKMRKWVNILIKFLFIIATIVYALLLNADVQMALYETFGIDLAQFTSARAWFFNSLMNAGYKTSGYGTTTIELGRAWWDVGEKYLEMDLVKILLEVGIVGLVVFVWTYMNLARNNMYNQVILCYLFANMLFSHSLTNPYYWAIMLFVMGYNYYYQDEVEYFTSKRKYRYRKINIILGEK